ncbi:MAG: pilin [bacterium]|nr:pilin [bacterium]
MLMTKKIFHPVKLLRTSFAGFNGVKYSLSIIFLSMILVLTPVAVGSLSINQAQATEKGSGGIWWNKAQLGGLNQVGQAYGGGNPLDARRVVVDVIYIILGFLGILAVILIIYAGFKWMLSRGNDDEVSDAKKILIAGVIGLVIILSAYIIANFVIERIYGAVTGESMFLY